MKHIKQLYCMLLLACMLITGAAVYAEELTEVVNDNQPDFKQEELVSSDLLILGELDDLGRCTVCSACIGPETLATEERVPIGDIRPTGWHQNKYEGIVDSTPPYLYNRCHLIGYQLLGEVSNDERNLITGTRAFNIQAMLPYENQVAEYVRETGHHVIYRVTPQFDGDNLLASGVIMEAESVEDEKLIFAVYCRNEQPGVYIDYATGENKVDDTRPKAGADADHADRSAEEVNRTDAGEVSDYILNTNTKRFHYPYCGSVDQMKDKNKEYYSGDREELLFRGYKPCGNCNP